MSNNGKINGIMKTNRKKPVKKDPFKGTLYTKEGQWRYPGQVTKIPGDLDGTSITMKGVPYPVYGQDDLGYSQMMYPGIDYQFPGQYVTETPIVKYGGWLDKYQGGGEDCESGDCSPEGYEKEIRDVEQRIGNPSQWTMEGYNELQDKLNEYKWWRENTPEGKAVVDYHNEPNEYVVFPPAHLNKDRYNMKRALKLGYQPDETGHWPSVDYESGEYLKSKKHPTAWMEYLYGYTMNPEQALNYDVRVNPEGYFGEDQLQYVPKQKKGGWLDELPKAQTGREPIDVTPKNTPTNPKSKEFYINYTDKDEYKRALQARQDSLNLYNLSNKLVRGKYNYPENFQFPANPRYGWDKDYVAQDYLIKYNPEGIDPDTGDPLGVGLYREEVLKSLKRKIKPLGYIRNDFSVPVYKKPVVIPKLLEQTFKPQEIVPTGNVETIKKDTLEKYQQENKKNANAGWMKTDWGHYQDFQKNPNIETYIDNSSPWLGTQYWIREKKKLGGSHLPKAQKGLLTYTNAKDYFSSRARFDEDQRFSDLIKKKVFAGTHGYDPNTKTLVKLDKPISVPKEDQYLASEQAWIDSQKKGEEIAAKEKAARDRERTETVKIAKEETWRPHFDYDGQDLYNMAGKSVKMTPEDAKRYRHARSFTNMEHVYRHPLWYAPGMIAAGAVAAPVLETIGAAAAPYITNALATQLPGMTAVPGATVGNAITAGFIGHGLANIGPDAVEMYNNPSWSNAGSLGIDALEIAPIVGPTAKTVGEGLRATGRALGTEEGLLSNAYKINPWRFKPNPEAYYHRSPNLENIINQETRMLQGFGQSEAGKAYSELAKPGMGNTLLSDGRVSTLNLRKPANNQLYFSKEVPLDYGRYNSPKKGMSGQGYEGPYLVEVEGVPMGSSTKGRKPTLEPPKGREAYATSHRPISVDEAKFYKEDWLKGYKPVNVSKQLPGSGNVLKAGFPNPLAIADRVIPRPFAPGQLLGMNDSWNYWSPLNLVPGYGKKLVDKTSGYPNFVGFRKFGNSLEDVIESQSLRPKGTGMGAKQIMGEGNWAEPGTTNEMYPGVFEATMNPQIPGSNIKLERWNKRNGIVGTTKEGNVAIPLTDPGLSFNRRLPFSSRYVPIDKQKLIERKFQLATQLPHVQSLVEKYGLWAGAALTSGYMMGGKEQALENLKTLNKYSVDPIINWSKKQWKDFEKTINTPPAAQQYGRGGNKPPDPDIARDMLVSGMAHGHPLTDKQREYLSEIAGTDLNGNYVDEDGNPTDEYGNLVDSEGNLIESPEGEEGIESLDEEERAAEESGIAKYGGWLKQYQNGESVENDPYKQYYDIPQPKSLSESPSWRAYTYGKGRSYHPIHEQEWLFDNGDFKGIKEYISPYARFDETTGFNYQIDPETNQPFGEIDMEGDKRFNLQRFMINPYMGQGQTKDLGYKSKKGSYEDMTWEEPFPQTKNPNEQKGNIFKDLYIQNLVKYKGNRDEAYKASTDFMKKRVEPLFEGAWYNFNTDPNTSSEDLGLINPYSSNMSVDPENIRYNIHYRVYKKYIDNLKKQYGVDSKTKLKALGVNTDLDQVIDNSADFKKELDRLSPILEDYYIRHKGFSPEDAKKEVISKLYTKPKEEPRKEETELEKLQDFVRNAELAGDDEWLKSAQKNLDDYLKKQKSSTPAPKPVENIVKKPKPLIRAGDSFRIANYWKPLEEKGQVKLHEKRNPVTGITETFVERFYSEGGWLNQYAPGGNTDDPKKKKKPNDTLITKNPLEFEYDPTTGGAKQKYILNLDEVSVKPKSNWLETVGKMQQEMLTPEQQEYIRRDQQVKSEIKPMPEDQGYISKVFDVMTHPGAALQQALSTRSDKFGSNWLRNQTLERGMSPIDIATYGALAYALPALGKSASPHIMRTLATRLPGANYLPGVLPNVATVGNALGLAGGIHSANVLGEDVNTGYYTDPNVDNWSKIARGLETGLGILGSPGMLEGIGASYLGLKNTVRPFKGLDNINLNLNPEFVYSSPIIARAQKQGILPSNISAQELQILQENPRYLDQLIKKGINKKLTVSRSVNPQGIEQGVAITSKGTQTPLSADDLMGIAAYEAQGYSPQEAAAIYMGSHIPSQNYGQRIGLESLPDDLNALYHYPGAQPINLQYGPYTMTARYPFNFEGPPEQWLQQYDNLPFIKGTLEGRDLKNAAGKIYDAVSEKAIIGAPGERALEPVSLKYPNESFFTKRAQIQESSQKLFNKQYTSDPAFRQQVLEDASKVSGKSVKDFEKAQSIMNDHYTSEYQNLSKLANENPIKVDLTPVRGRKLRKPSVTSSAQAPGDWGTIESEVIKPNQLSANKITALKNKHRELADIMLGKITERLEFWKTPEGNARLQSMIDNTPELKNLNITPEYYIKQLQNLGNENRVAESMLSTIEELQANKSELIHNWEMKEFMREDTGYDYFNITEKQLDDQVAIIDDQIKNITEAYDDLLVNSKYSQNAFLQRIDEQKALEPGIINLKKGDPDFNIGIGLEFTPGDAETIAAHEVTHLPQLNKTVTNLDRELEGLELLSEENPNLFSSATEEELFPTGFYSILNKKGDYFKNALEYFKSGSAGKEKIPFLSEIRNDMLKKGMIKNLGDEITLAMLKQHYNDYIITPHGTKYPLRLYDIMQSNSKNFKLLNKVINKLPVLVPAVGAGTILMNEGSSSSDKGKLKQGGWLSKYQ